MIAVTGTVGILFSHLNMTKNGKTFFINNASLSKTFDAFENLKTIQHFRKEYVTFMLQGSFISLFLLPLFNFS